MLCSIFLLEEDGLHLRYAAAPNLSEALPGSDRWRCSSVLMSDRAVQPLTFDSLSSSPTSLSDPKWAKFVTIAPGEWTARRLVKPHHVA